MLLRIEMWEEEIRRLVMMMMMDVEFVEEGRTLRLGIQVY